MVRLQVVLDPTEANALAQWAAFELRDPRDQIRFALRQALEQRGLLRVTDKVPTTGDRDMAQAEREVQSNG